MNACNLPHPCSIREHPWLNFPRRQTLSHPCPASLLPLSHPALLPPPPPRDPPPPPGAAPWANPPTSPPKATSNAATAANGSTSTDDAGCRGATPRPAPPPRSQVALGNALRSEAALRRRECLRVGGAGS